MKKGLRLLARATMRANGGQNRRPDEEGIKTLLPGAFNQLVGQNRRPDEEGIKTPRCKITDCIKQVRTVDLMKKGLRPIHIMACPQYGKSEP